MNRAYLAEPKVESSISPSFTTCGETYQVDPLSAIQVVAQPRLLRPTQSSLELSSSCVRFHHLATPEYAMVTINCAYTESINPAGSSPVLSRDQVWKALQIKTRHPQGFVPIISGTEILEENENEVVRKAHFIARDGIPAHSVVEVCKSYYPTVRCPAGMNPVVCEC